jgi:hypothetical protein
VYIANKTSRFQSDDGNVVSALFVPDQVGTATECNPTELGDMQLFSFLAETNLVVLGWIHVSIFQCSVSLNTFVMVKVNMHTRTQSLTHTNAEKHLMINLHARHEIRTGSFLNIKRLIMSNVNQIVL